VSDASLLETLRLPHAVRVILVAVAPEGDSVGIVDRTREDVLILDPDFGAVQQRSTPRQVSDAEFSPRGTWLALGGALETVLWDPASGETHNLPASAPLAFSPDGKLLAASEPADPEDLGFEEPMLSYIFSTQDWSLQSMATGTPVGFSPDDKEVITIASGTTSMATVEAEAAVDRVCSMIGRDLTRTEWAQYGTDEFSSAC